MTKKQRIAELERRVARLERERHIHAAGFDSSRAVQWTGTAYRDPHATVSISIGETAGIPEGVLN